jgi:hypothetical protein
MVGAQMNEIRSIQSAKYVLSPYRAFPANASSRIDIRMGLVLRDRLTGFHKTLPQV